MTTVRRPAVRERVPRAEYPNFRDDRGGALAPRVLRLLQNLQRGRGEAWASESGLRQMICEDSGHMPGVGSVPAVLDRLQQQGMLEQVWILAGSLLPTGEQAHHGTRGIHVAVNRAERMAIRARNVRRPYRERRLLRSVEQAKDALTRSIAQRQVPTSPPAPSSGPTFDEQRAEALTRLRELEARWRPPE